MSALLIWENTNQLKSEQIKSYEMLAFEDRGKPEYPGKNHSEQSREPTNSTHIKYGVKSGNRSSDTLVEGECSHHCASPAP